MKDFDDLDEVMELLEKAPEMVQMGISVSRKVREALAGPAEEAAEELKKAILTFAPFGKLVRDAMQAMLTDDVIFRARLVCQVQQVTNLSEQSALAIVLARSAAFTKAIESIKYDNEKPKKPK